MGRVGLAGLERANCCYCTIKSTQSTEGSWLWLSAQNFQISQNSGRVYIFHIIHSYFGQISSDCGNCSQNPGPGSRLTG